MSDYEGFGPAVAETAGTDDHPFGTDPRLTSEDGKEPAPVWASSQRLREVIDRREPKPPEADRRLLAEEAQRQLATLGLLREVVRLLTGPLDPRTTVSLAVILFPGEGRDNTGIKDLNDKVLGYGWTSEFILARQAEIRGIFPPPDERTGPRYITVGQDYKTASIVAVGMTPEDFAAQLAKLDDRLRDRLLEFLAKAEKDADAARRREIKKLRDTLEASKRKKQHYRFDFLFGSNTLSVRGDPTELLFQLLTEALKGAGLARFAAKGKTARTRVARKLAAGRGVDKPDKGHDPRGRVFRADVFLRVLKAADDLRNLMTTPPNSSQSYEYRHIFVDTVWTTSFLKHRRVWFGNPDVIRDVRKRALVPPKALRDGVKYNFAAHRDMLELFLVTLNLLDFVKEFTSGEYPDRVREHHAEARLILEQLPDPAATLEWPRLVRFLTHDIRRSIPVPVQGTASEFQFYCYAADRPDQLFFAMDIRDLGVDLMAFYEAAQVLIVDGKLTGAALLLETLQATDSIVERKRATYDQVVAVFRKHYRAAAAGAGADAAKAFGTAVPGGAMPVFQRSLQVMLGGDEVFVVAHPRYASVEHLIVADIAREVFQDRPLNLRTGVAYSSAPRVPGATRTGPTAADPQRQANQRAHDQALKLATDSLTILKPLERTHRRIERLIEKLETNDKKKDLAPPYRKQLQDLRLLELYVRRVRGSAKPLPPRAYARLHRLLKAGDLVGALNTKLVELVDFTGMAVDRARLEQQAAALEAAVRKDVGWDNYHADVPPAPGWIKKLIDLLFPPEKPKTA